jgi:hypothetical protein
MAFHNSPYDGNAGITPGFTHKIRFATHFIPLPSAVTNPSNLGPVLLCSKKHFATYIKPEKALSLRVEDIGRRRFLT